MSETLFKMEEKMSRKEISQHLREIADKLERGTIELKSGNQSVKLKPADTSELEIEAERDVRDNETSLEIEIEWKERANGGLEIG